MHILFQSEINAPQPKMSTKKCACFTPSGLVYTRLETDGTILRRPSDGHKENATRNRRSIDNDVFEPNTVESILEENPSIGHLRFLNEPFNESENKNTKEKIDELIKETEAYLKAYERTKENIEHKRIKRRAQHSNHNNKHKQKNDVMETNNESSLECKIEKDGTVNCSQLIYNDLKAWHTNRLSLEDQIRQLRTKLEDLKEIKRHLKTSKPMIEMQTAIPTYPNQHVRNKSPAHETNSKDQLRKTKLHRMKLKQKNNSTLEKKLRQSNEYVLPTVNANTKEDIFKLQQNNETAIDASTRQYDTNNSDDEIEKNKIINTELPKPQVTTIIIERNYFDQNLAFDKTTIRNIPTTVEDVTATEYMTQFVSSDTEHKNSDEYIIEGGTTVQVSQHSHEHVYSTIKTTPLFPNVITSDGITTDQTFPTNKPNTFDTTNSPNLGPTRFDASEYEQRNPNKAGDNNLGVFSKPSDIFQRRLHPLFIENEDKHVCYCEENR